MKTKKILAVILSLCLISAAFSCVDLAASAAEVRSAVGASSGTTGDCTWKLSNGTLIISGEGDMAESYKWGETPWGSSFTTLIVMDGVRSISGQAFAGNTKLTTVQLGGSVEIIKGNAFNACSNLKTINLPYGLKELENHVFFNCSSLERLIMPNTLEKLGINLCCYCSSLSELTLSTALTSIELTDFSGCTSLTSVVIPDSIKKIALGAFMNCTSLSDITLPEHVNSISAKSFENTAWMASLPDGIFYYDGIAVFLKGECPQRLEIAQGTRFIAESFLCNAQNIENLTEAVIPSGIRSIPYEMFKGCSGLSSVGIPSSVTSIGSSAFENCSSLESVALGGNIASIGSGAFRGSGLRSVTVPAGVTVLNSGAFQNCAQLEAVSLPGGLTKICGYSFMNCASLTRIELPDSVVTMNGSVFRDCGSLQTVILGSGLTKIEENTFNNCTALKTVNIPEGVTEINDHAFYNCSALERIELPDSLASAGSGAFGGCASLERVDLPEGFSFYWGNYLQSAVFSGCTALERVTIPRGVNSIRDDTFNNCPNLTIYGYADSYAQTFAGDNNIPFYALDKTGDCLWSVEDGILTITGSGATADYTEEAPAPWGTDIKEVVVSEGVTRIGARAFYGCARLDTIRVPDSVLSIGKDALTGTRWLDTEPVGVRYVGKVAYTFKGDSPARLRIKDGALAVADSAFEGVSALTEAVIPDSVTRIGSQTFKDCASLNEIELSYNVSEFGSAVFENCDITIRGFDGSKAKTYASNNSIPFVKIGGKTGDCRWRKDGSVLTVYGSGTMETHASMIFFTVTYPWGDDVTEVILGENVKLGMGSLTYCEGVEKITVLNKSATLSMIKSYLPSDNSFTLYGFSGSTAQTFADRNSVPFVAIGDTGDANLDGRVDIDDATAIQKYLAKLVTFGSGQLSAADVNCDGTVNILDATAIQRIVAGLEA